MLILKSFNLITLYSKNQKFANNINYIFILSFLKKLIRHHILLIILIKMSFQQSQNRFFSVIFGFLNFINLFNFQAHFFLMKILLIFFLFHFLTLILFPQKQILSTEIPFIKIFIIYIYLNTSI